MKIRRLQVRWRKFWKCFTFQELNNVQIDISDEDIHENLFLHID